MVSESLEKIAEISKDYRHIHAELKLTLGDTRYDSIYVDTKELVGQMRQFTKDAKSKMRLFRKQESSALETGKSEFEKKKFASEEEYSSDRLTRSLASVQVPDLKHRIRKFWLEKMRTSKLHNNHQKKSN